jgi:non-specific serine/threonine protein kinase/serine/threonine-protein kinase
MQPLGEGGMGEVWLAEQTEPFQRRVALKIIKRGMDSKRVVACFEAERQALAMMDHPAVAKVFDAGTTPRGRPYFVMEYVKGLPITEHCDRHRLSNRERLVLFREVCEGVQHAHQKAIIHRDLKPTNVLVTEQDGKRLPKIIDFGVAKATAHKLTEKTVFTELGVLIGTPEYMSPEQAVPRRPGSKEGVEPALRRAILFRVSSPHAETTVYLPDKDSSGGRARSSSAASTRRRGTCERELLSPLPSAW